MSKVTFLAPIYNKEAWVGETIESLVNQTLDDIEIVFVDDGSTDKTRDIVRHYMKEDKRIRLVSYRENKGLGYAWNIGTQLVRSKIICVASGDDIYVPDRAKITLDYFRRHPEVDVFYGSFYFTDAQLNNVEFKRAIPFNKKILLTPRADGFCPQNIGHFTMAYRIETARKVKYRKDLRVGIDYPFIVDLIKAGSRFGWTKKVLGYARLLKSGVSLSRREEVDESSKKA